MKGVRWRCCSSSLLFWYLRNSFKFEFLVFREQKAKTQSSFKWSFDPQRFLFVKFVMICNQNNTLFLLVPDIFVYVCLFLVVSLSLSFTDWAMTGMGTKRASTQTAFYPIVVLMEREEEEDWVIIFDTHIIVCLPLTLIILIRLTLFPIPLPARDLDSRVTKCNHVLVGRSVWCRGLTCYF